MPTPAPEAASSLLSLMLSGRGEWKSQNERCPGRVLNAGRFGEVVCVGSKVHAPWVSLAGVRREAGVETGSIASKRGRSVMDRLKQGEMQRKEKRGRGAEGAAHPV